MLQEKNWHDSDRWLTDMQWAELERCSLEWLESGEPLPPPAQLATLQPLIQRLLEFTLASGRANGTYRSPPRCAQELSRDEIERLYDTESTWQEHLTRDCDRMLRPYRKFEARLLVAIRDCDPMAPVGPQLRRRLQAQLKWALLNAAQEGVKAMWKRNELTSSLDHSPSLAAGDRLPDESGDDDGGVLRMEVVDPRARGADDERAAHVKAAKELASVERLELTISRLLSDREGRPFVLAAIAELDQQAQARESMAPPALLFLDDFRMRVLSPSLLRLAFSLQLFVGRHSQTRKPVTMQEAAAALESRAGELARAESIPKKVAFDRLKRKQDVLWDVLRDLGVSVESPDAMKQRLKRTRDRLIERTSELVRQSRQGHLGIPPVTAGTNGPKKGGDHP